MSKLEYITTYYFLLSCREHGFSTQEVVIKLIILLYIID